MMVITCQDMVTHAVGSKKRGMIDVIFLSDFIQPGHPFWEELSKSGFSLHSSCDKSFPVIQKSNSIVVIDAIVDTIPNQWLCCLIENEHELLDIPRVLLVMQGESFLDEKVKLFQCDTVLQIEPCDRESIKRSIDSLISFTEIKPRKKQDDIGWQNLSRSLLSEIYQYRSRVDIFHKIFSLAPSIKEYDFTLHSILKQVNQVFKTPLSSLYIRQDDVIYTLVNEPISKNFVSNQINEFLKGISDKGIPVDNIFEITWGRNLIIGDFSQVYNYPTMLVFPLESKGDNLGYWAIPSSDEKCVLDDAFVAMVSQQITLLIKYSWLYKKQGLTVRSNLHRLGAINEVCKLFADIDGHDFGLQFLLILLEHISADKGLLILMDDSEAITDYHCVGVNKEDAESILRDKDTLPYTETYRGDDIKTGVFDFPCTEEDDRDTSMHYFGLPLVGVQGNNGAVFIFFKSPPSEEEDFLAFFKTMAILAGTHFESIDLYHQYLEKRIIEEQINIAREIQRGLLPKSTPDLEHFQVAAESRPATQVGGDFYDFITLPSSRQVVLIGDVSGKGIPASQLMSMTKSLLKFHLEHSGNLHETMCEVNKYLTDETPHEKFVTVQAILIDEQRRIIEMVNAGHEFLLVRRSNDSSFEEVRSESLPLGVLSDANFNKLDVSYQSGDIFLMFTDGLPEAMSPEKKIFGIERIKDVLKETWHLSVQEILDAFFKALDIHAANSAQHDDTTIIVLKAK